MPQVFIDLLFGIFALNFGDVPDLLEDFHEILRKTIGSWVIW